MKVLVFDSDPFVCKLLDVSVRKNGHECRCVHSKDEVISALKKEDYCLVFISLAMSHSDGFDVAKLLRDGTAGFLASKVPIIAMTHEEVNFEHFRAKGFTNCLRKPFLCQDIDLTLRTICTNSTPGSDGSRTTCSNKCYLL
ncbi:MAG: hypothetical protein C0621_03445 [Desulfuromonas sp.]|nr:MAG: hypothetical protein C0621_03445 [Desulfuromonas sp.]